MSPETLGLLIPFFAIGLGIATMITWLVLWHRHRLRDLEMRHLERMAAIQQGMEPPDLPPPPPGAFPPPPPAGAYPPPPYPYPYPPPRRMRGHDPARYLLRGLVWLGIGLALSFGRGPWDSGLGQFGWIAVAVGVAYLIYYGVDHGRYNGPPPPPQPPGQGPGPGPGAGPDSSWRNGPPPPPPQS
jgi:hypothetical protein